MRIWKWIKDNVWLAIATIGVMIIMRQLARSTQDTDVALKLREKLNDLKDHHKKLEKEREELHGMAAKTTIKARVEAKEYEDAIAKLDAEFKVEKSKPTNDQDEKIDGSDSFDDFTYKRGE